MHMRKVFSIGLFWVVTAMIHWWQEWNRVRMLNEHVAARHHQPQSARKWSSTLEGVETSLCWNGKAKLQINTAAEMNFLTNNARSMRENRVGGVLMKNLTLLMHLPVTDWRHLTSPQIPIRLCTTRHSLQPTATGTGRGIGIRYTVLPQPNIQCSW